MSQLMSFLRLERRPTSVARLGRIALILIPSVVVLVGFGAPLWVAYDLSVLSPGDTAAVHGFVQDGPAGAVVVESVNDDGTVTVLAKDGRRHTVSRDLVSER